MEVLTSLACCSNKTEQASVMWVLTTPLPTDADKNYAYANREPWWGDSSAWINVDIASDPSDPSSLLVRSLPSCLSNLFPPPSPLACICGCMFC